MGFVNFLNNGVLKVTKIGTKLGITIGCPQEPCGTHTYIDMITLTEFR